MAQIPENLAKSESPTLGLAETIHTAETSKKYQVLISGFSKVEIIRTLRYKLLNLMHNPHNNNHILALFAEKGLIEHIELEPILLNVERKTEFQRILELFSTFYYQEEKVFMEFLNMLVNLPNQEVVAAQVRKVLENCYPGSVQNTLAQPPKESDCHLTPSSSSSGIGSEDSNAGNEEVEVENTSQPEYCTSCSDIEDHSSVFKSHVVSCTNDQSAGNTSPEKNQLLAVNPMISRIAENEGLNLKNRRKYTKRALALLILAIVTLSLFVLMTCLYFVFWKEDNSNKPDSSITTPFSVQTSSTTEPVRSSAEVHEDIINSQEYTYSFAKKNSTRFGLDKIYELT